jgi:type IV pili sensor histidine kinase/response regulator
MSHDQPSRSIAVFVAAAALAPLSIYATANEAFIARYSEVSLLPSETQRDPLLLPVQTSVPDELARIGDVVEWVLNPSGYRLAPALNAMPERAMLLALPLPVVHRSLEGLPVRAALQTLAGSAFRLVEDPVHRVISFEPCVVASGRR